MLEGKALVTARPVRRRRLEQQHLAHGAPAGWQPVHRAEHAQHGVRLSGSGVRVQVAVLERADRQMVANSQGHCVAEDLFMWPNLHRITAR